jgi:hypothetical protein
LHLIRFFCRGRESSGMGSGGRLSRHSAGKDVTSARRASG